MEYKDGALLYALPILILNHLKLAALYHGYHHSSSCFMVADASATVGATHYY